MIIDVLSFFWPNSSSCFALCSLLKAYLCLGFSFWCSGEPNNYHDRNEDCVEIWYYDREDSWNDGVCEKESFYICEKKMAL